MKILVIAPTPFFASRGTHIRILEEALALSRRGHTVTIATYHIGSDIPDVAKGKIDIRRIRRLLFWYKKLDAGPDWQKIILNILLIRKVFFLARTEKPDILYGHIHEGALIGWMVQKMLFWRKIPLVCDFHGGLTSEMVSHGYLRASLLRAVFVRLERWINSLGNAAVTSSWENTAEVARSRKKSSPPETILDGVASERYENLSAKDALREKWELPKDKMIFLYAGALIPNKGVKLLYDAILKFSRLSESSRAFFVLAGAPPEEAREFIAKNNLESLVRLIHPLDYFDLSSILSACDVGIDPKDSSVFQASGKILQYAAAALPVLCFDRENNRNYLEKGGVYIKERTAAGLVSGIRYCLEGREALRIMGEMNRRRAEELFSWDRAAEKIEKVARLLIM